MSVSFYAASAPIVGFDLECVCGARYLADGDEPMTEAVALMTLTTVKAAGVGLASCEDEDCFTYGVFLKALDGGPDSPEVNMANGNVRPVLAALGLAPDHVPFEDICVGAVAAEDFLGRLMIAEAAAPVSAERPQQEFSGEEILTDGVTRVRRARMIVGGVAEGYVQHRLVDLRAVAEFALAHSREVRWS